MALASDMSPTCVDIFRFRACVVERRLHHEPCSEAFGVRRRDVVCIAAFAFAYHFGVYLGSAGLGVLQFLEDEASCSLCHDEAVTACAERA